MKRLSFLLLAIVLSLSSALAEPIAYNNDSNTITFEIASMPTNALKEWIEALDPSYDEYKNIEAMVFKELSKRGEIAWISEFKSTAAKSPENTTAPSSFRNDGTYIPGFQSFMNAFYPEVVKIDDDLAEAMTEKCKTGMIWADTNDREIYGEYDETKIQINEAFGYLEEIMFTLRRDEFSQNEPKFKELIIAATRAILPDRPESFYTSVFDAINYQYVIDSPASSIIMHTNFDVYQFGLHKTSYSTYLQINLSLYEN